MSYKEVTFLIGNGKYFPKLYVKIDKQSGSFLYCVILYILIDGKTKEVCHCDNYHNKGHHIHYMKLNGEEEKQETFAYEGIGQTVDFLQTNWRDFMTHMKK